MDSAYDFDAPQFIDLREIESTEVERYFDVPADVSIESTSHYNAAKQDKSPPRRVTFHVREENDENEDPLPTKYSLGSHVQTPFAKRDNRGDVDSDDGLLEGIEKLKIDSSKKVNRSRTPLRATQVFEGIPLEPVSAKKHLMVTRSDAVLRTPKLSLRSRDILKPVEPDSSDDNDDTMVTAVSGTSPRQCVNRELKRRSFHRPVYVANEDQPSKFVALAEQVANFHKETPDRYRTKPHQPWRPSMKPPMHYVPKTPVLAALHRKRTVHFPPREEREQKEYEEMMKRQVKALPINEKIFKEVSLGLKAPIEKRPSTRPEPFNLTEFKPKPVVKEEPLFHFRAQPVPRKILESPCGIPPKIVRPVTTPKTPHITMPMRMRVNSTDMESQYSGGSMDSLNRTTKIAPFSFEARDKMIQARKEEYIKKVLEEEKKSFNSFKAQPVRAFSRGTPVKGTELTRKNTTVVPFNLTKPQEKKLPEVKPTPFKARPASVLKQRPFCPTHKEHAPPQVAEFSLKTADRAQERQKYEEKMQKQEEEYKKALEEQRLEKEKEEAELLKKLRQQAEFKAKPVPKTKAFEVRPSEAKLTDPMSPCFLSGKVKKSEEK